MSKFCQILLATSYVWLTAYGCIAVLQLWGMHISALFTWSCCVAWAAYCFSAAYLWTGWVLARCHVRRPIKSEEDKLNGCFREVLNQAGVLKTFRLLIQEEMGCNAFAIGIRTIVVSHGLLDQMTPEELKAVLAHELGHLQSKDSLVGAAFFSASSLPRFVLYFLHKAARLLVHGFFFSARLARNIRYLIFKGKFSLVSKLLFPALLMVLFYRSGVHHYVVALLATVMFPLIYHKITDLFRFLWKITTRFTEYKQDEYACRLGYGSALRQALLKLASNGPQVVSLYEILIRGDHPVIYNRIRRLEKIEGLR